MRKRRKTRLPSQTKVAELKQGINPPPDLRPLGKQIKEYWDLMDKYQNQEALTAESDWLDAELEKERIRELRDSEDWQAFRDKDEEGQIDCS